jgi:hypothetical protein
MEKVDLHRMVELLNNYVSEDNCKNKNCSNKTLDLMKREDEDLNINLDNLVIRVPKDFFKDIDIKAEKEALEKKLEELNY